MLLSVKRFKLAGFEHFFSDDQIACWWYYFAKLFIKVKNRIDFLNILIIFIAKL